MSCCRSQFIAAGSRLACTLADDSPFSPRGAKSQSQHFAGLKPAMDSGLYQMGGAVLNEVPQGDDPSKFSFAGSTIVIVAESRDEIKEILKKDVYATSGVWDVENVGFYSLLCSPGYPTYWMACLLRLCAPTRRKCGRFCAHSGTR